MLLRERIFGDSSQQGVCRLNAPFLLDGNNGAFYFIERSIKEHRQSSSAMDRANAGKAAMFLREIQRMAEEDYTDASFFVRRIS
jgi:hypothetical protein